MTPFQKWSACLLTNCLICFSPRTGSLWWRYCPRGPSGWRTVTSPGLEAAQTCSEPPAASRCPRAEWYCGKSLWSGISTGARTLAASPCPYTPNTQTGNTHRAGQRNLVSHETDQLFTCEYWLFSFLSFDCCSLHLRPPVFTGVVQSLLVFGGPHLAPSLPLVRRTPGVGLEAAGVSTRCWWRSSSPRYLYSVCVCVHWIEMKRRLEVAVGFLNLDFCCE